jgi:hypothetical protein
MIKNLKRVLIFLLIAFFMYPEEKSLLSSNNRALLGFKSIKCQGIRYAGTKLEHWCDNQYSNDKFESLLPPKVKEKLISVKYNTYKVSKLWINKREHCITEYTDKSVIIVKEKCLKLSEKNY